jgi:hypothetical protein
MVVPLFNYLAPSKIDTIAALQFNYPYSNGSMFAYIIVKMRPWFVEFLTYETTCTNEMAKRTTSEKFCQKTPPANGGTLAQATRGTCRLGQCRHVAVPTSPLTAVWPAGPCRLPQFWQGDVAGMPPPPLPAPCFAAPTPDQRWFPHGHRFPR